MGNCNFFPISKIQNIGMIDEQNKLMKHFIIGKRHKSNFFYISFREIKIFVGHVKLTAIVLL